LIRIVHHELPRKMKKILVPTDFSAAAANAMELAERLAKEQGAGVHLLHAIDVPSTWLDGRFSNLGLATRSEKAQHELYPEVRERLGAARQQLEAATLRMQKKGITAAYTMVHNTAWKEVVTATSRLGADLVVMGTHGAGALEEAFLGSHAQRVIRMARVPVLTLKVKAAGRFDRVLLLADPGDKGAEKALRRLMAVLDGSRKRFHLLWVNTPGRFVDSFTAQDRLTDLVKRLTGVSEAATIDHYTVEDGAITYALRNGFDVIALSTHGRKGLSAFSDPSIAETLANLSPIPTLTLRQS
jgi:nucleotide-binding universal stress UspA family protein